MENVQAETIVIDDGFDVLYGSRLVGSEASGGGAESEGEGPRPRLT